MSEETSAAFLRLFLAIAVPVEVRERIGRAQGQLRRNAPPGAIRWTKPEQFHLTLKFLGDVPAEQFSELEASAVAVCSGFSPLDLSARGLGFFPGRHKPRVIWAGAADRENKLPELHRLLDDAMRSFAPADRPGKFTGHITMGRFKPGRRMALEPLWKRADILNEQAYGDWRGGEVEIVRCDLSSNGAVHTPMAVCRLGG